MFFQKKKKRILFSQVLLFVSVFCWAQNRTCYTVSENNKTGYTKKEIADTPSLNSLLCDTVSHFTSADAAFLYKNSGTGNWGYICGTNSYKDKAKAEKFLATDYNPANKLMGVIFFFAKAKDGDTASTMMVRAWDNDGANGYPSTALASVSLPVSAMQTGGNATIVMFQNPVNISGDFYLGLDSFFYQTVQQDTVTLYSDSMNAHPNNYAFEKWNNNTWHAFEELSTWNTKLSLKIAAILCDSVSIGIQIVNPTGEPVVYPNPSDGYVYLSVNENVSEGAIHVFDAAGKEVLSPEHISKNNGTFKLSLHDLSPGVYFIRFVSNNGVFSRKIIIN